MAIIPTALNIDLEFSFESDSDEEFQAEILYFIAQIDSKVREKLIYEKKKNSWRIYSNKRIY